VLDCFGGSGTTIIAAERTGRRAVLLEIDPAYCDVIVKRYINLLEKKGHNAVIRRNGKLISLEEFNAKTP
jgi:DNA modification methylase